MVLSASPFENSLDKHGALNPANGVTLVTYDSRISRLDLEEKTADLIGVIMQSVPQSQLVQLPQRPNCTVRYTGDPCDELMQQYNQAVQQRQQQEWDAAVAAPLRKQIAEQQKQIADQQNQIQMLQLKIESQTTAALQSEARNRAALDLVGACLGVGLAFFVAFASFQRLARNGTPAKPDRGRVASAGS